MKFVFDRFVITSCTVNANVWVVAYLVVNDQHQGLRFGSAIMLTLAFFAIVMNYMTDRGK